jgi:hypothetical protein
MRKLALSAVACLALIVPTTAQAGGPPPKGHDEHGSSCLKKDDHTAQCGKDNIQVVNEPPGANCPNGGVKIIANRHVSFVCNGATGTPGAPGAPGTPGAPGAPGTPGATPVISMVPPGANCATGGISVTINNSAPFYLCNGANGLRGPQGPAAPTCASQRVATWRIIVKRGHTISNLTAYFEGVRTTVRQGRLSGHTGYFVRIDLRGLSKGVYGGRIFYMVSVNGHRAVRNTQVHLFRTCYGNVRGGIAAGLNRIPYTPI